MFIFPTSVVDFLMSHYFSWFSFYDLYQVPNSSQGIHYCNQRAGDTNHHLLPHSTSRRLAFLFLLVWLQSKHCAFTVLHSGQMVMSLNQSFLSNKIDEVMPLGIHTFLLFPSLTITQPFLPFFMPFSTNSIESCHFSLSRFSNTGRWHSTLFRGQAPVANCPCLNLSHVLYFTWPLFHQCLQP